MILAPIGNSREHGKGVRVHWVNWVNSEYDEHAMGF